MLARKKLPGLEQLIQPVRGLSARFDLDDTGFLSHVASHQNTCESHHYLPQEGLDSPWRGQGRQIVRQLEDLQVGGGIRRVSMVKEVG